MSNLTQFLRGAAKVTFSNTASGLTGTTVQAVIDELDLSVDGALLDITNLQTLSGVADGATTLGTFTGTVISDNASIKGALQDLETNLELRALDADVIKKDGSVAFTADQSMGGFKLTNLATPTANTDAATKLYVDNLSSGVIVKSPVRLASTGNINLGTAGLETIDGVQTVAGDRVLLKSQNDPIENGIYIVSAAPWLRSSDTDGTPSSEVIGGISTFVNEGTVNSFTMFRLQGNGEITVDTDPQVWVIYSRAEATTASNGVTKTGLNFSLTDANVNGINVNAGVISVNVDGVTIERGAGAGNPLLVKDLGITEAKLAATSVSAAKLGTVAGAGLSGGNGISLSVDYSTTGEANKAVEAISLLSTTFGLGASLVGIADQGTYFAGNTVESVLQEVGADFATIQSTAGAAFVGFDNTTSGLTATDVQDAIDEVEGRVQALEGVTGPIWVIKTANYTAVNDDQLLVDTLTVGAVTITLPATPSTGDEVKIRDAKRNTETNAITVARNGSNIEGLAENLTLDVNGSEVHFVYMDATTGWTVGLV